MNRGDILAKLQSTSAETRTLSITDAIQNNTDANAINAFDAQSVFKLISSASDLEHRYDKESDSTTNELAALSSDIQATTKNKRKNFKPRNSTAVDSDPSSLTDQILLNLMMKNKMKQLQEMHQAGQFKRWTDNGHSSGHKSPPSSPLTNGHSSGENAYNAVQDLLSVYGLSMSSNDIVDAFSKRNESSSIRDLANNLNEQKNGMRFVRRQLRDTLNPYVMPEERFYEMYRMPPTLAIKLTEEFRPFVDDTDDIPLHLQVLSLLNFYASGSYQRRVGSDALCCVSQSKVSQIIEKLSYVGYANLSEKFIRFPTSDEELRQTKERFRQKYNFPGIIGIVKGVHFYPVFQKPIDTQYINRKGTVSINGLRRQIFAHLEIEYAAGVIDDSWLLGDSGFPLQPFLLIPVPIPDNTTDEDYNKKHHKIRKVNERCIGFMKGRFKCLTRDQKLKYSHAEVGRIVTTCAVLQNFLIKNGFDVTDLQMVQEDVPTEPLRHQNDMYTSVGTHVRNNLIYWLANNK